MYRIKRVTDERKKPVSSFSSNGLSHSPQQDVKCKDGLFAIAPEGPEALAGQVGCASCHSQPGIRDGLYRLGWQCPRLSLWAQRRSLNISRG